MLPTLVMMSMYHYQSRLEYNHNQWPKKKKKKSHFKRQWDCQCIFLKLVKKIKNCCRFYVS